MATLSKDFLEVHDSYPVGKKPRSHSSGHVDRLEEQERIERRDRDRQMKEYHDNTRRTPKVHHRTNSDHLHVPIWETNRRPRPSEGTQQPSANTPRDYRVEEVRPSPVTYDYDLDPKPALSNQLLPSRGRPPRSEKMKAKAPPIIIQGTSSLLGKATEPSPMRNASASPHSPTARPVLHVQYGKLQNGLTQISGSCEKYLNVEPANPQDLTFSKIQEIVEGFAEDLHIWSHVVNLDGLARIDRNMRHLVDAASDILDRVLDRVYALREACTNAKPKDLKMPHLEDPSDDLESLDGDDDDNDTQDPTESPGFVIHSLLRSVGVQIRQLKLLSASLQEATPDVEDEMKNVARLVKEAGKFFGSDAALVRYSIDPKFAGQKAFVEARSAADTM